MNRDEWYRNRAIARVMIGSIYSSKSANGSDYIGIDDNYGLAHREMQNVISDKYGYFMLESITNYFDSIYPIKNYKWAVRHNSKQFNRNMPIRESKKKWKTT